MMPIRHAARRLGVHENTIRGWIQRNLIAAFRLPSGVHRIPVAEVERLEAEVFGAPTSFAPDVVTPAPKKQRGQGGEVLTLYP